LPRKNSYWRHRNGNIYQVTSITNLDTKQARYPVTVNYIGPNGKEWSKRADEWFEKMTPLTQVLDDWLQRHQGQVLGPKLIIEFQALWHDMMQQVGDTNE